MYFFFNYISENIYMKIQWGSVHHSYYTAIEVLAPDLDPQLHTASWVLYVLVIESITQNQMEVK